MEGVKNAHRIAGHFSDVRMQNVGPRSIERVEQSWPQKLSTPKRMNRINSATQRFEFLSQISGLALEQRYDVAAYAARRGFGNEIEKIFLNAADVQAADNM